MSRPRGVYRGLYSSLVDDPDFQALRPSAKLTLLIVRICSQAGPAAIFRYYPELLQAQTGLGARGLEAALVELERDQPSGGPPWLWREGVVIWVRNGLRHDPFTTLANPKHRASVETALKSLPRLRIVLRFCDYYGLPYPFDSHTIVALDRSTLTASDTDTEEDRRRPNTSIPAGYPSDTHAERAPDKPVPAPAPVIPESIQKALKNTRLLNATPKLWTPEFWLASIRATNGHVEYAQEILKAEAWLIANPKRAPNKDLARFMLNWLSRAGERV